MNKQTVFFNTLVVSSVVSVLWVLVGGGILPGLLTAIGWGIYKGVYNK